MGAAAVQLLHPEEQTLEDMLTGWCSQQPSGNFGSSGAPDAVFKEGLRLQVSERRLSLNK